MYGAAASGVLQGTMRVEWCISIALGRHLVCQGLLRLRLMRPGPPLLPNVIPNRAPWTGGFV
jgi:hypothetical protein